VAHEAIADDLRADWRSFLLITDSNVCATIKPLFMFLTNHFCLSNIISREENAYHRNTDFRRFLPGDENPDISGKNPLRFAIYSTR
jgi:hypothetical protein